MNYDMNKAGSFVDPQGKNSPNFEKTIFIWLDILGFADAVENELEYEKLSGLLNKFKKEFDNCNSYTSQVISDGIILSLKQPSPNNLSEVLDELGKQQFKFTLKNNVFIRGGISIGSKFKYGGNIISNGLAKAVKIENKDIAWPIIGTRLDELKQIRQFFKGIPETENFNLLRTFNDRGEDVYFIDFLKQSDQMLSLIKYKIEEFNGKPKVRAKYIWLFKYYIDRFGSQEYCSSIEGAIL